MVVISEIVQSIVLVLAIVVSVTPRLVDGNFSVSAIHKYNSVIYHSSRILSYVDYINIRLGHG